jgi:hypothetical protein
MSLVVGTILTLINEGPTVVGGHLDLSLVPRAVLNYVVPFCVSCYSSMAAENRPREERQTADEVGEDLRIKGPRGGDRGSSTSGPLLADRFAEGGALARHGDVPAVSRDAD